MKQNLLKTLLVAAGLLAGTSGTWAGTDLSEYNLIKTLDFTTNAYPTNPTLTLSSNASGITAYETGNARQQTLYDVVAPAELAGQIYFQNSGDKDGKGWYIASSRGGLWCYNANRSAAIPNLKKDYVVVIKCSQTASNVLTLTNATGDPDGNFTYELSDDGYSYYCTMTADGYIGFCGAKSVGYIQTISVYAPNSVIVPPTGKITNVNGKSRTVEFSGENIAYNTDGSDTYTETNQNTWSTTVSEATTFYVVSTNGTSKSEPLVFVVEAGTEIKLNAPSFVKTEWADGKATYAITNNQSNVLLVPDATIICSDASVNIAGTNVSLAEGTYTFHAEATGYTNSDDVTVVVTADRNMVLVETLDYSQICASYNAAVTKSETSEYNDGTHDYYPFAYASTYSDEAKDERLLTNDEIFARSGYGLQNQKGNTRWMAITGLKAGQIVKFTPVGNTGGNAFGFEPTENDKAVIANESTTSVPAIEVLEDGTIAFTIGNLTWFSKIEIYSLYNEVSVGEAGLATYCPSVALDFSNATKIAAYKASVSDNTVTLTKVETVAAGEGVLLRALNGGEENEDIPVAASAEKASDNAFVGTLDDITVKETEGENTNYVLSNEDGVVGFFKAAVEGTKIAAGKAYLPVSTASAAKGLTIVFDGETTGISEVSAQKAADNVYYTISGVRVQQPTKGLYIVNGKKVVIK